MAKFSASITNHLPDMALSEGQTGPQSMVRKVIFQDTSLVYFLSSESRQGKGGKYREVPLNATARRILGEYLAGISGEWLFPGKGGPMTRRGAEKTLAKLARLSGVEVTPHRLRHTFCKMLVDAGESLDRVAVLAGHGNLNVTARYTKPGRADLEAAVEKIAWE